MFLDMSSRTAFASWNLQATRMLVKGDWVPAIFALILGTQVAIASFGMGEDLGQFLSRALHRSRMSELTSMSSSTAAENVEREKDMVSDATDHPGSVSQSVGFAGDDAREHRAPQFSTVPALVPPSPAGVSEGRPSASATRIFLSAALLVCLLSASIVGSVLDDASSTRRRLWLSCTFAPVGALGRWQLARLNKQGSRFPLGTFAANTLAALLDAALAAIRVFASDTDGQGQLSTSLIDAGITGAGGTLSTVSTWVGEITAIRSWRGNSGSLQVYTYVVSSILAAQVIGVLVYGAPTWAKG